MFKSIIKWVKRLFLLVWFVVLFLIGAKLAQRNAQPVAIDLVAWQLPEISSGVLVCIVFALGVAVGVFAVAPLMIWNSRRVKRLKNKNVQLQNRIQHHPL